MNPVLFTFSLIHGLIICPAVLYHHGESTVARSLAVDTGATHTMIHPNLVDTLKVNYAGVEVIQTTTAAEKISFPKVTIQQIGIYQANARDVDVLVGALPQELEIDGILGYSFLRHFRMTVDYSVQELTLVPTGS